MRWIHIRRVLAAFPALAAGIFGVMSPVAPRQRDRIALHAALPLPAPAACDSLCRALQVVLAELASNFTEMRAGDAHYDAATRVTRWDVTNGLPGMDTCWVYQDERGGPKFSYTCFWVASTQHEVAGKYAAIKRSIAEAIPADWITWVELPPAGSLAESVDEALAWGVEALEFAGPDSSRPVIGLLFQPPRVVEVSVGAN